MNLSRRLRSAWPALCLLACTGTAQATPQLQPIDDSLTPDQAAATRELLADAVQRLPTAWADALEQRIEVEWRDDLPAQVHGRAQARRLLLDRALLDAWMARPRDAGIEDPATRAALAAVIHELAHFYDRTPQGQLSHDPRLLDLAGWQVSPMRLGLRSPDNAFRDRSPDRYELTSPGEFVAVNLEYFLLDPAYACRRPALYRHFAAHFGSHPPPAECAPDFVVLQASAEPDLPPLLQLDPERVYAVDYLLAEGNEKPLSRWGHSMLRLVICAPGRVPGPDCRFDLQYHQVLSFRAFVGDVQISTWRGLDGLLSLAPVRAAAGAGHRGVHEGRVARPAVDPFAVGVRPRSPRCWNAVRGCTGATTATTTSSATTAPSRPSSCCTTACRGSPTRICPASRPPACCVSCSAPASRMPRCWRIASKPCAWATTSRR